MLASDIHQVSIRMKRPYGYINMTPSHRSLAARFLPRSSHLHLQPCDCLDRECNAAQEKSSRKRAKKTPRQASAKLPWILICGEEEWGESLLSQLRARERETTYEIEK